MFAWENCNTLFVDTLVLKGLPLGSLKRNDKQLGTLCQAGAKLYKCTPRLGCRCTWPTPDAWPEYLGPPCTVAIPPGEVGCKPPPLDVKAWTVDAGWMGKGGGSAGEAGLASAVSWMES